MPVIMRGWDLIIMHPPCTALCVSGNRWYGSGMPKYQERIDSIEWTAGLFELAKQHAKSVAMENPVGVLPMKAMQYIQPWQFGHDASKSTCLWLKNLPLLTPTAVVEPRIVNGKKRWANQTDSGQNRLPPSEDRWKIRSETYAGIAAAMVAQWA